MTKIVSSSEPKSPASGAPRSTSDSVPTIAISQPPWTTSAPVWLSSKVRTAKLK